MQGHAARSANSEPAQSYPTKPIRLSFPVGLRRPLYCAAVGKLLLAHQPEAWIDDYLQRTPLVPYTPHTQTDPEALRALNASA